MRRLPRPILGAPHRAPAVWLRVGRGWCSLKTVGIRFFIMAKGLHRGKQHFQKINLAGVCTLDRSKADWCPEGQLSGYSKTSVQPE